MLKIFGVNFLKTRNFGMVRLCLKVTNCKEQKVDPMEKTIKVVDVQLIDDKFY